MIEGMTKSTSASPTRVALYARVSTDKQSTEAQLRELRAAAEARGWAVVAEYVDAGVSGSKRLQQRPKGSELLKDATRRRFDVLAAWSVDRLGRSLQDLVGTLEEVRGLGLDLYLHQQAIDTRTPAGRALFGMLGVFAEFERAMIVDRVNAGIARAKAHGTKSQRAARAAGRPSEGKSIGRPQVGLEVEERIRALRTEGLGIQRIARQVGCGVSTVQRVTAAMPS